MTEYYCVYCHKKFTYKKEYDKHLACCQYFYHLRRTPFTEMDDYGNKMPSQRELFRFIQDLAAKCERLEKEVAKLKSATNTRQKKYIVECLNRPSQLPDEVFSVWWHRLNLQMDIQLSDAEEGEIDAHWSYVSNSFLFRIFSHDLVEGIKFVLQCFIETERKKGKKLPIRTFTQKQNMFYIYCGTNGDEEKTAHWRVMSTEDFETLVDYIMQLFVREFLAWQRENSELIYQDEKRGDEQMKYMMRVNRMNSREKGIAELRKWLFAVLEENVNHSLDAEFE
jgi:hypothetical protein